jgi:hypothetical protein
MKAKIRQFIKLWSEVWSLPAALILWLVSPYFLRLLDSEAGVFDAGVLQTIVLVQVMMLAFNGAVWLGIRFNFPTLFRYYAATDRDGINSKSDWKNLTPYQRICVLLCCYLGLLLAFVLLAQIL